MDYGGRDYFHAWFGGSLLGTLGGALLLLFLAGIVPEVAPRLTPPSSLLDGGRGQIAGNTAEKSGSSENGDSGQTEEFLPPGAGNPIVEIARKVGPAVVGVVNIQDGGLLGGVQLGSGSGIIFDSRKGYIVTNFHVVDGSDRLLVSQDEGVQFPARLVGTDRRTDLAVLQVRPGHPLVTARFGRSENLQVGETVVAIGNPLGREFARSVTVGVVSALNRLVAVESRPGEVVTLSVLQTDAAINPGNSGGALVNMRGEVIGINSVKIARPDVEGMGFALPSDEALPVLQELVSYGYVSRPFLGIYDYVEVTPELARSYDLPRGILVGGVVAGGPAARAGVKTKDILTEMDGTLIRDLGDLMQILGAKKPGRKVGLLVQRGGRSLSLEVVLGELPRD